MSGILVDKNLLPEKLMENLSKLLKKVIIIIINLNYLHGVK